ncbi:MAG TPA: glycoside hydrolase family 36 protein [Steroidobacter sp.]
MTPRVRRRAYLSALLLVGWASGALNAAPATDNPAAVAANTAMRIEFDPDMRTRVLMLDAGKSLALTEFGASEYVVAWDGNVIDQFALERRDSTRTDGPSGPGTRHTFVGVSPQGLEKTVQITFLERHPGLALAKVTYTNRSDAEIKLRKWINHAYTLLPTSGSPAFWSYQGASYEDRRDWVQPLEPGFEQRNYMGMNASDYGGGTPVVDIWRRDAGLAVGHVELTPKLVALPVTVSDAGAQLHIELEKPAVLEPGQSLETLETFLAVHHGDYFRTLLAYRAVLAERGLTAPRIPETSYEPIWCAWGYERDFTVEQVIGTLPKVRELGLKWAVVDDGWQTAEGDWKLDPKKFPRGDADMIALVQEIKRAGLRPKLWVAPLAVDPGTDLLHDHPELLLLDENGAVQDITWWNSFYLCPAAPGTLENAKALVRRILGTWGYEGLKIDGQHLNGVPPCYNPAHHHRTPEESVEKLQEFWKELYATAMEINPNAVIEICPCGTSYAVHNTPYMNQAVASDPESSWQVRLKGKTLKALMGPDAPYAGDHVELSDGGNDFASTIGVGAILSTKFTWPSDQHPEKGFVLDARKDAEWAKWVRIYNEKMLPKGRYRGELYDIGFDKPEAHAVEKDGRMHYAFYAPHWKGTVELRGLKSVRYRVRDYVNGTDLGTVQGPTAKLPVEFQRYLLLEATPIEK